MPWEIFRTSSILPSTSRPVTFVTKGGGLPGYFTYIIMVAEYDLGITIFTAGESSTLLDLIREAVTVPLLKAAEEVAQLDLSERYTGTFTARHLNSSLVLAQDDSKSLYVESFISNSTDTFTAWRPLFERLIHDGPFRIQLVPTLLYRDEKNQRGELWRGVIVVEERNHELPIWDDDCTTDIDQSYYAGKPLLEIVFWGGEDGKSVVEEVEMSAFKVKMGRVRKGDSNMESAVGHKSAHGNHQEIMMEGKA